MMEEKLKCCFSDAHPQWGDAQCDGPMHEERNYTVDGKSRFICTRHLDFNRLRLLRRHRFEPVKESQ